MLSLPKLATLTLLTVSAFAPVAAQAQTPPLLFPIAQGARWQDTFGAPRVGHSHQGEDLMAPKMRPLIACFAGTVTIRRNRGSAGNWITLRGSDGWRAEYMHLNNDTPGTNDGRGGDQYAFAPALQNGTFVQAGQFLGYVGNSGNAETTGSHCHFELHGPGGVINPAAALQAARILPAPQTGIALPVPTPQGPLRVTGTLLSYYPGQGEAIISVTSVTEFGGSPVTLDPPRVKRLIFGNLPGRSALKMGKEVTAEGSDLGRGRPLQVARLSGGGADAAPPTVGRVPQTSTVTFSSRASHIPSVNPVLPAPLLPERFVLEGFERGAYQGWSMEGDCWGRAPENVYGSSRIHGAVGQKYLSTAHARPGSDYPVSGTGRALSSEFSLTHTKLRFVIGGGSYPGECGLNLLVDGKVVRTATGNGSDHLLPVEWDIAEFTGKKARLEILDTRRFGMQAYVLLDQLEMVGLPSSPSEVEVEAAKITRIETAPVVIKMQKSLPVAKSHPSIVRPRAFVVLPDGTRLEGARLMTLEATGYGPGGNGRWGDRTALGTKVGYGTVAVDPRVIPLRKRLWVEGYGFCVARDTGGAIKGNRIDLGHDSDAEAMRVGRRKLRVLVLD